MNAEKTIIEAIRRYPDLYSNRTDVLHHMFIVIGNGYRWSPGGNLVTTYSPREKPRLLMWAAKDISRKIGYLSIENRYHWSNCCKLATMPQNVAPDWFACAHEIYLSLQMVNFKFYDAIEKKQWKDKPFESYSQEKRWKEFRKRMRK